MHYAILAAGEGSRLRQEGVVLPKPLVKIAEEAMIERLLRIFLANRAESVTIIVNEASPEVEEWLNRRTWTVPFHLVVQSTPGSMHSFKALSPYLPKGKFCLTTVDTIFNEEEFAAYIEAFEKAVDCDGMMGVTDFIDDESPLYVETNSELLITDFRDRSYEGAKYISGGIYGLSTSALAVLEQCFDAGKLRMREFQRELVYAGQRLKAYPFSQIIDVDHAGDIQKAEVLATQHRERKAAPKRVALLSRAEEFSPNSVENDTAMLMSVYKELKNGGFEVELYSEENFALNYQREKILLHMARRTSIINQLLSLEKEGILIINSPTSIQNCDRLTFTQKLQHAAVPHPPTIVLSTSESTSSMPFPRLWVKKAKGYSQIEADTCYVEQSDDFRKVLQQFQQRGVAEVVINEHIEGDLVKFYGVSGTEFFHYFYPTPSQHSKFGQEQVNGEPNYFPFEKSDLESIARKAATMLELSIWGGDAVITPSGEIFIIDMNDFPSFRPCKDEAAKAIVSLLKNRIIIPLL